jgi:hypothetical protein
MLIQGNVTTLLDALAISVANWPQLGTSLGVFLIVHFLGVRLGQ